MTACWRPGCCRRRPHPHRRHGAVLATVAAEVCLAVSNHVELLPCTGVHNADVPRNVLGQNDVRQYQCRHRRTTLRLGNPRVSVGVLSGSADVWVDSRNEHRREVYRSLSPNNVRRTCRKCSRIASRALLGSRSAIASTMWSCSAQYSRCSSRLKVRFFNPPQIG